MLVPLPYNAETNITIEDDGKSMSHMPSSVQPSIHSGPSRKNEKRRANEIEKAPAWGKWKQGKIDRYTREDERSGRGGLGGMGRGQPGGTSVPLSGFPSGGQQAGGVAGGRGRGGGGNGATGRAGN
jgi:hypothetical protein